MTPPTSDRHMAGHLLGGRYTLLAPIAQGGMGEVWKARDSETGRLVAAKVLRPELSGQELSLSRLRIEARNAMRIQHPNIASVLDSGEEDGRGWIVMELVEGRSLTDYLRGGARIAVEDLIPVVIQVALALDAAAAAGVVHRDIKPANILIRPDGVVKLTDFGISRTTDQASLTAAGMVMGTAQYLPPEQAMGETATSSGDLYALGVIAYEAAAGRRPFTGPTQVDIAFSHVNDPVPPLPEDVPAPFAKVVTHLLQKEPHRRPATGAALVRELVAAAHLLDMPIAPHPLPLPDGGAGTDARIDAGAGAVTGAGPMTETGTDGGRDAGTGATPGTSTSTSTSSDADSGSGSVPTADRSRSVVAPVRHEKRRVLPAELLRPPSADEGDSPSSADSVHPGPAGYSAPAWGSVRDVLRAPGGSATDAEQASAEDVPPQEPTPRTPATRAPARRDPAPLDPAPRSSVRRTDARDGHSAEDGLPHGQRWHRVRQPGTGPDVPGATDGTTDGTTAGSPRPGVPGSQGSRSRQSGRSASPSSMGRDAARREDTNVHGSRDDHGTSRGRGTGGSQGTGGGRGTGDEHAPHRTRSHPHRTRTSRTGTAEGSPRPVTRRSLSGRHPGHRDPGHEGGGRPGWHPLGQGTVTSVGTPHRRPARTRFNRSVVAPPVPLVEQIGRWVVIGLIVLTLILIAVATIQNRFGSLTSLAGMGAHVIEEARTCPIPWTTV